MSERPLGLGKVRVGEVGMLLRVRLVSSGANAKFVHLALGKGVRNEPNDPLPSRVCEAQKGPDDTKQPRGPGSLKHSTRPSSSAI